MDSSIISLKTIKTDPSTIETCSEANKLCQKQFKATDGSFCSVFQAYIHIQRTYTSRYKVWGSLRIQCMDISPYNADSLHTMYVCMGSSPCNCTYVQAHLYALYGNPPNTMYVWSRHLKHPLHVQYPGHPGWKFRIPHAVKNSLKAAILIYDFVTFWPKATDGSFCLVFQAFIDI